VDRLSITVTSCFFRAPRAKFEADEAAACHDDFHKIESLLVVICIEAVLLISEFTGIKPQSPRAHEDERTETTITPGNVLFLSNAGNK